MTPFSATEEMERRQILQNVQDYMMKKGMKPNFAKSVDEGRTVNRHNDLPIQPYNHFMKNIRKYMFPDETLKKQSPIWKKKKETCNTNWRRENSRKFRLSDETLTNEDNSTLSPGSRQISKQTNLGSETRLTSNDF